MSERLSKVRGSSKAERGSIHLGAGCARDELAIVLSAIVLSRVGLSIISPYDQRSGLL